VFVKFPRLMLLAACCVLTAAAGGCGKKIRLWPRSGKELAAMAFGSEDPDIRREGVVELSKKSYGLRPLYLDGYAMLVEKDKDASVRCAAVRALGKAGDPNYVPQLAAALSDESEAVRWDAAVALSNVHGPEAVEPLRRAAVSDESAHVRAAAAKALRLYRRGDVVQTLRRCLMDDEFSVRYEAHASLVAIAYSDQGYDPKAWEQVERKLPEQPVWSRPWWDWFSVTRRGRRDVPAQTQPAKERRPWWDWFSVTRTGGDDSKQ